MHLPEWINPLLVQLRPMGVDVGLLALAAVLGGLIGWQRETQGRPAGLRTHILVCMGACLLTRIRFGAGDPGRIAAQVVTGIGFLGAGVILRRGVSVRGLTTAATIWLVAAVGIACGASPYYAVLATIATVFCLITLITAKKVEEAIRRGQPRELTLSVTVPRHRGAVSQALATLTDAGCSVLAFETETAPTRPDDRTLIVTIRLDDGVTSADLSDALTAALPGVTFSWDDRAEPVRG